MTSSSRFVDCFFNDEGYRILGVITNDELKLLHETKKILDKRISLDEQYAKNLQELTASADRIAWPVQTHPIAAASREVFLRWSSDATLIADQAKEFRKNVMDSLLKNLIDEKTDSKRFLEDEKRRYDSEHRKAMTDVTDVEKRYADDSRAYEAKNQELARLTAENRKNNETRITQLKAAVLEKRGQLYRTHNEYLIKLHDYNFTDEQYLKKVRQLLVHHEQSQLILNQSWRRVLEEIVLYSDQPKASRENLVLMVRSLDPRTCYVENCRTNPKSPPLTPTPHVFNTLLQSAHSTKLTTNQFYCDKATIDEVRKKLHQLKEASEVPSPKLNDSFRGERSYNEKKTNFERKKDMEYAQAKQISDRKLLQQIDEALNQSGYTPDSGSESEPDSGSDEITDRLEDQLYFHGVIPRGETVSQLSEPGDYLVRKNERGEIVLSILWYFNNKRDQFTPGHYVISHSNGMYCFNESQNKRPTVHELLTYYKRQKLLLRDDGTRLIRPIPRPSFMINNDDIQIDDLLGKGHFGQVNRGLYKGEKVAVKVLHPSSTDRSGRDRKNFVNEAMLLQAYKHKNIVKFIGIAAIRDPMMIVMELVENGSLSDYLKKNDVRSSQLSKMCLDIAKGMAYLEKNNVIHRDLAARNCLVANGYRIKVADFGLSRCLQTDEEYFVQTKEVPVRWWAVEVFTNSTYTIKSDVWSYGITAWEVYSKADLPYAHIQYNHQVIDAVKHGERLRQPDRCRPNMFTIITRCWSFSPTDRPSFSELVDLIKRARSIFP